MTLQDILEAIVGEIPSAGEPADAVAVRRDDGSWLLDGSLPVDRLPNILNGEPLPQDETGEYETVGGFVLARFGHVSTAGESFQWGGWRFEVVDMDGRRVDKLLATELPDDTRSDLTPPRMADAGFPTRHQALRGALSRSRHQTFFVKTRGRESAPVCGQPRKCSDFLTLV
ncbi:MAG: hypothetical protein M3Q03_09490 [Chloroflexota bacterium]|nr:hypothetical protein [Chloroflexota bacterium]